jgi:hypothetical protein
LNPSNQSIISGEKNTHIYLSFHCCFEGRAQRFLPQFIIRRRAKLVLENQLHHKQSIQHTVLEGRLPLAVRLLFPVGQPEDKEPKEILQNCVAFQQVATRVASHL